MWMADSSARGADLIEGGSGMWGLKMANSELHYVTAEMTQGAVHQMRSLKESIDLKNSDRCARSGFPAAKWNSPQPHRVKHHVTYLPCQHGHFQYSELCSGRQAGSSLMGS